MRGSQRLGMSTKKDAARPFGLGAFFRGGRYRTRTARAERSEGNQSPSGALISARFPTPRNVYQERCRQTIRPGGFFSWWRYRTRTAAEATAACGGNREPRLGQRSDFSKPCQGAAEKSANATRTGASRQIPSRFPTPRNVYRDDCRFVVGGTGREPERAKAGYHYGSGILPFAILNRVWYTRLSSTNLHLED